MRVIPIVEPKRRRELPGQGRLALDYGPVQVRLPFEPDPAEPPSGEAERREPTSTPHRENSP